MRFKSALDSLENSVGFKNKIDWYRVFFIFMYHVLGIYWCWNYLFPVQVLTVFFAGVVSFITGIGITCGAHRLFTHRSYKAMPLLRLFLLVAFSAAGQNSVYQWVRDHRLHHKFVDGPADPHNASRGLFFSHIGWLMVKKNEHVLREGRKIDMSDITQDKMLMLQHKYIDSIKLFICFILPTAAGVYFWGESWECAIAWQCFVRYLYVFHSEQTVNSLAHTYGYRPYNPNIRPGENALVSTLALGEGWHNYHHVFPYDYKAAEFFDKINISAKLIKWWSRMGWAYDLKEVSPDIVQAALKRLNEFPSQ